MGYVEGVERTQATLFPQSLDEYIAEENPVRFIDAFVAGLDLQRLGFAHAVPAATGRPPYDPADMLRLYIYGYLNRVRSSRRLEQEAVRNVEVMWLLRKLRPDFKTIADFRKDNRQAIRHVCRQFTELCRRLELFGGELVAVDSSKFAASNSQERNFTRRKLERTRRRIDEQIEEYLRALDAADASEGDRRQFTAPELRAKIAALTERRSRYERIEQQLVESGEQQVSLTDPDARAIARSHSSGVVGYNVQTAVDAKYKLIVTHEVTNTVTDNGQLSVMASQAKAALQTETLAVVADMGYYHGHEVKQCLALGITPYVAKPNTSANTSLGLYGKEDFRYDAAHDCYRCPAGQTLTYRFQTKELGRDIRYYTTAACRTCARKPRCTRNQENRRITRWVDEHLLEKMQRRVAANPNLMAQRKALVEHPFGVIKHAFGYTHFLLRGLEKVRAEMSLTVLAFNVTRVMNIVGVRRLITAVT